MPVHLTDKFVVAARARKRANVADDVVPGLRLRISPSGIKAWAVYYRLRESQGERLYTLGQYPDLSLGAAREEARRILARARLGEDPQGAMVQARAAGRVTPGGDGVPSFKKLQKLFAAAKGSEIENLLDLIARTGARSHEARAARWEDFDEARKVWTIPIEMQKTGDLTGEPHVVPLTKGVLEVLKRMRNANTAARQAGSAWLFPAPTANCDICTKPGHMDKPNKASDAIKKAAAITDRGLLHRFRDTLKTRLSEHGIDGRVSEHILGHVVPGIAGVYDHAELLPQRREALTWWDKELGRILKPKADSSGRAKGQAMKTLPRTQVSQGAAARGRRQRPSLPSPKDMII